MLRRRDRNFFLPRPTRALRAPRAARSKPPFNALGLTTRIRSNCTPGDFDDLDRERIGNMLADDRRRNAENLQEPKLSGNPKLRERLREVGERHDAPPFEAAIAWTLRNPAVSAALAGGRGREQVDGVVGAADLKPSDDEVREIEGFVGQSA